VKKKGSTLREEKRRRDEAEPRSPISLREEEKNDRSLLVFDRKEGEFARQVGADGGKKKKRKVERNARQRVEKREVGKRGDPQARDPPKEG